MKRLLLLLILIAPFTYAEADLFAAAKQAQLDAQAYVFIAKMNYAIEFFNSRGIKTDELSKIKANFESKLNEAMQAQDKDILNSKYESMKDYAMDFKEYVKLNSNGTIVDLKAYIKSKYKEDNILKEKIARAKALRQQLVLAAFETKISKLKAKIDEETKAGKEVKVEMLLLDAFENDKKNIDKLNFKLAGKTSYESASEFFDGVVNVAGNIGNFFAKGYRHIVGGRNE